MFDSFSFESKKFQNSQQNFAFEINSLKEVNIKGLITEIETIDWSKFDFDYSIVFFLNNKLYLKRDSFGNIPLYYFIFEKTIYFSTKIETIINHENYKKEINHAELYNYLIDYEYSEGYIEQTIWKNIYSVIPGLLLEFGNNIVKKYINTFEFKPVKNKIAGNHNFLFNELFINRLKQKINFDENVCSALSGGIDSSTISSFAQSVSHKKVKTIEFRIPREKNPERKLAQAVVDQIKSIHSTINLNFDNLIKDDYFTKQRLFISLTAFPSTPYSVAFRDFEIIKEIKNYDGKYYLTGVGGDDVMVTRAAYLNELFLNGDWKLLKANYIKVEKLYIKEKLTSTGKEIICNYIKSNIKVLKKNKEYLRLIKYILLIFEFKYISPILKSYLRYLKRKILFPELYKTEYRNLINHSLNKNENPTKGSFAYLKEKIDSESQFKYILEIFRPQSMKWVEQYYSIEKKFGFRYINPYLDLKLIEFVSKTPCEVNFCEGYGRGLSRKSGYLPIEVQNRLKKTFFNHYHFGVFHQIYPSALKKFDESHKIWEFIDFKKFKILGDIFIKQDLNQQNLKYNSDDLYGLLRIINFGIWLEIFFE